MSSAADGEASREEHAAWHLDQLLPWYVTGQIDAAGARAVKRALTTPDGASRLACVQRERDAVVRLCQTQGCPSARVADRLLQAIDGRTRRTAAR